MSVILTLELDETLAAALDRLAEERRCTKQEIVQDVLRQQLAVAAFERARAELVPLAEQAGWLTDEDVFEEVS